MPCAKGTSLSVVVGVGPKMGGVTLNNEGNVLVTGGRRFGFPDLGASVVMTTGEAPSRGMQATVTAFKSASVSSMSLTPIDGTGAASALFCGEE
jgi:hypothetical protein